MAIWQRFIEHRTEPLLCPQDFAKARGATYPVLAKVDVNGSGAIPLYKFLKDKQGRGVDIEWNFAKYVRVSLALRFLNRPTFRTHSFIAVGVASGYLDVRGVLDATGVSWRGFALTPRQYSSSFRSPRPYAKAATRLTRGKLSDRA